MMSRCALCYIAKQQTTSSWYFTFKLLQIHGFWYSHHAQKIQKYIYSSYTCLIILLHITNHLCQMLYIILQANSVKSLLTSSTMFVPVTNCTMIIYNLIFKRNEIDHILNIMWDHLRKMNNKHEQKIHKYYHNYFK